MKVERFDQSDVRMHSRVRCTKRIIVNVNTSFSKERACYKAATFHVDGEPMCSAHAGQTLLEEALRVR